MPTDGRIFSEKEIGLVLKRAAEIQTKRRHPVSYGLSIEELQQLASESGLDPSIVEEAALELDSDQTTAENNWWGGPLAATFVRSVEGPLSDETWEELLAALRRRFKHTGETERRGTTRQWMFSERDQKKGHLIATYKNGRTELELFWANPVMGIPFIIIPFILSIISLPIIFEGLQLGGLGAFAVWSGIVAILLASARAGIGAIAGNAKQETADLADELARVATSRAVTPIGNEASLRGGGEETRDPDAYLSVPDQEYGDNEEAGSIRVKRPLQ